MFDYFDEKRKWTELKGADPYCFACGEKNPYGLSMNFERSEGLFRSELVVAEHLRGWDSLVHGGVLSTILDEAMSWAAIHIHRRFILTQSIDVSFKRPVFIKTPVSVYASVLEAEKDSRVLMQAEIFNEKKELCTRAEGLFVLFTGEEFAKFNLMKKEDLKSMLAWFGS